jgi:hypothetical protein
MTAWKGGEFNEIGIAEQPAIESLQRDGTLRNPATV